MEVRGVTIAATSVSPRRSAHVSHKNSSTISTTTPMTSHTLTFVFFSIIYISRYFDYLNNVSGSTKVQHGRECSLAPYRPPQRLHLRAPQVALAGLVIAVGKVGHLKGDGIGKIAVEYAHLEI